MTTEDILIGLKRKIREIRNNNEAICECCGYIAPLKNYIFENHHDLGKEFSKNTIMLCLNCHRQQQKDQNFIFSYKNNPSRLNTIEKIVYMMYNHASLREIMDKNLKYHIEKFVEEEKWKNKSSESTQKNSLKKILKEQ